MLEQCDFYVSTGAGDLHGVPPLDPHSWRRDEETGEEDLECAEAMR
jgi:hypothetical protein